MFFCTIYFKLSQNVPLAFSHSLNKFFLMNIVYQLMFS